MAYNNSINLKSTGIVKFDGASVFSAAGTGTSGYFLVGGASNALTGVGNGSSNNVYVSGGAGTNASMVAPTVGTNLGTTVNTSSNQFSINLLGGLTLIQTQNASSSSAITFTSGITTTYNNYLLLISNLNLSSGTSVNTIMQISSNGGSSYITTDYTSGANAISYTGTTFANGSSFTSFRMANNYTSANFQNYALYLNNFTNGTYPSMMGDSEVHTTGACQYQMITGGYGTAIVVNAFQILPTGGNITSGTFTLYGIIE